jgi:STE24 endopeptidase
VTLRQARLGTRRRERVAPWALAAILLALIGIAGSIWRPFAPPVAPVPTDLDAFGTSVMAAVEAYRAPRYVVGVLATIVTLLVPLLIVGTAGGRARVRRWAGGASHAPLQAARVGVTVAVLTSLATLPFAVWSRIVHDGRWGFRTQSAWGWAWDWLVVSAGRWVILGALVAVLFASMRRWPRSWPFRLTVLGVVLAAVFVALHPVVVQPLLLPTSPLPEGETRESLEELLRAAGDPQIPLHVGEASLRTTRVNAVVVGLGPTERVVIHDTLLELPAEQVAFVVAHELAHHEHADLVRGILLSSAGILLALLIVRGVLGGSGTRRRLEPRGPTDPRLAAVLLALVAVLEFVGTPAVNVVSRRVELAADARALELSGEAEQLIRTSRAFTVRDLSAPDPPTLVHRYFGTHPSVGQRIRYAVAWAEERGLELPDRADLEVAEREVAHPSVTSGPP